MRPIDPNRWNLERLCQETHEEDSTLAEAGLAEWADALDQEDRRSS